MTKKTKLELTWPGKDERPKLEPRILIEDPARSYHASVRREGDLFDNMLIKGDNLLALKALEQSYEGKIKCIYIDPPYNTGDMLEQAYPDGLEHSIWLSQMRDRFVILRNLLSEDGTFFCQLNDDEMAYAKVVLDEVFGRGNFLNQIAVRMKLLAGASGGGEDKRLKKNIEHILVYAKNAYGESGFSKFNDVYESVDLLEAIEAMEDAGKSWKYTSILLGKGTPVETRTVLTGDGEEITVTRRVGLTRTTVAKLERDGMDRAEAYNTHLEAIFSDTNAQTSIRTRIIDEFQSLDDGELLEASYVPRTGRDRGKRVTHYYIANSIRRVIWLSDIAEKRNGKAIKQEKVGTWWEGFPLNNLTKEGGVRFPNGKKPEALIQRILELATDPGDLVLDSFGGSGTTGAVAHKMGRRWIMVEIGDHAETHIVPRLQKVVDGADQGGISKAVDWKGGGGFRYFTLAPSLLEQDKYGNWVIAQDYNPAMLAEAMCKHMGFTYAPAQDPAEYWRHGHSTETDFIYVTTQALTHDACAKIAHDVGPDRSLLICCKAYDAAADAFENLTLVKIPTAILQKCEWGRDDYSLNIQNLPMAEDDEAAEADAQAGGAGLPLFGGEAGDE